MFPGLPSACARVACADIRLPVCDRVLCPLQLPVARGERRAAGPGGQARGSGEEAAAPQGRYWQGPSASGGLRYIMSAFLTRLQCRAAVFPKECVILPGNRTVATTAVRGGRGSYQKTESPERASSLRVTG